MKKFFNVFCCVVLCGLMVFLSGCSSSKERSQTEAKALEYLNANYNDIFSFKEFSGRPGDYTNMTFYSHNYGDEFTVQVDEANDSFLDNYFEVYMRGDAEHFFGEIITECELDGAFFLTFNNIWFPDSLEKGASFYDCLDSGELYFGFYFMTAEPLTVDEEVQLAREFSNVNIHGDLKFLVSSDVDWFKDKSADDILSGNYDKYEELSSFEIN